MQKSSMALATVVAAMALCAGEGAWGASFQTLYSFKGGADGANPTTLTALGGTLYGTTVTGGQGGGTVFTVTPSGVESVLSSFGEFTNPNVPDGLIAFDGALFGSSQFGGGNLGTCSQGCGTLFGVAPRTGKERVVVQLHLGQEGVSPGGWIGSAVAVLGGVLYGAAASGGANNSGVVFKTQGGVETVVYSFKGGADGYDPNSLTRIGNALYGTTSATTAGTVCSSNCGTIFKLTPDGTETVLHNFAGGTDGANPGSLVNGGGEIYAGISFGGPAGFGKIVKLKAGKMETVYAFKGGNDGAYPSSLILVGKTLYGTTSGGGGASDGTLFELSKGGEETVLHTFGGSDGIAPIALVHANGAIYGVTISGGANSIGTVFSYAP